MPSHASVQGKDSITIAYIRPPRYMWPILSPTDNFLLPLAYPALAAWLKKTIPGNRIRHEIVDCCVREMGWESLRLHLQQTKPDIVCVGEKVVYGHEAMRALRLAKEVNPGCITIGGGHFFSALPAYVLANCPETDYIIRYEGEKPLEALLRVLLDGGALSSVPNLCYLDNGTMRETALGDPVMDLTELPMPDYQLGHLDKYGPDGVVFPKAITMQRGRGCVDTCQFCSWIALEAKHTRLDNGDILHKTFYRSKSVEQVVSEIDYLYYNHGRTFFKFVDATWNLDPAWLDAFSEAILKKPYKIGWWAYFRLDQFLQQEKLGVAEKYVRAGLTYILSGVERADTNDLQWLNKHNYGAETTIEAFQLLKNKYPSVFRHGTLIPGLRNDTPETIKGLLKLAHKADFDFASVHPLTPYPGTPLFDQALREGWIEEWDFAKFDMNYPIMGTNFMSREEVAKWAAWLQVNFIGHKPWRWFARMASPVPIRRRMHVWCTRRIGTVAAGDLVKSVTGKGKFRGMAGAANDLREPSWYNS